MGDLSCGLRKRTPSSVTWASWRRDTIWKLGGGCQSSCRSARVWSFAIGERETYPPLSVSPSQPQIHKTTKQATQLPVKILCSHPCNLCAPPTASSVFCPGFSPLHITQTVSNNF